MTSLCTHLSHALPLQPCETQPPGELPPPPGSLPRALKLGQGSFSGAPTAPSPHHTVLSTWPPASLLQALRAETWSVLLPAVSPVWHFSEEINEARIGRVTQLSNKSSPSRRQASWVLCCVFCAMFSSICFPGLISYSSQASTMCCLQFPTILILPPSFADPGPSAPHPFTLNPSPTCCHGGRPAPPRPVPPPPLLETPYLGSLQPYHAYHWADRKASSDLFI